MKEIPLGPKAEDSLSFVALAKKEGQKAEIRNKS